jgi:hypothetical protein
MLRDLTCERPNYNPNSNNQTLPEGIEPDEALLQFIEENDNLIPLWWAGLQLDDPNMEQNNLVAGDNFE